MWTGWSARCGLFSRNNVLRCPQEELSQVSQRWVKRWVSVFIHVHLGNRKEKRQNMQRWQRFCHAFWGFECVVYTRQVQRIKRLWTSHTDKCINIFVPSVVKSHQPKQWVKLRQKMSQRRTDSKTENQRGLLSIWDTNTPCYWKRLKTQTFFMEIREINSIINMFVRQQSKKLRDEHQTWGKCF